MWIISGIVANRVLKIVHLVKKTKLNVWRLVHQLLYSISLLGIDQLHKCKLLWTTVATVINLNNWILYVTWCHVIYHVTYVAWYIYLQFRSSLILYLKISMWFRFISLNKIGFLCYWILWCLISFLSFSTEACMLLI